MKKLGKLSLSGISLLAVATAGYAATAAAQDKAPQASDNTYASSEIIVTARRRDESIQDVPLVVQAVTSEAVEKLNFRKFEDITAVVPGLNVAASRGSAGSPTTLRGVNFQSGVSGSNTTVGYYFNDAVVTPGSVTFQLFDIEQVEVLRGPQGTLRGRSTPSGSINFRTKGPNLSSYGGYASASVYSYDGHNLNGALNVPIIQDKLAVRIAGLETRDQGDTVKAIRDSLHPYSQTRSVRGSVRADPFNGILLLDFVYQHQDRKQRLYEQVESANTFTTGFGASPDTIRGRDRRGVEGLSFDNRFKSEIFNWQAQLNLYGQKLTYVGIDVAERFTSSDPQDDAGVLANDISPTGVPFVLLNDTPVQSRSHEIRLQNEERVGGIFDYVVGALFSKNGAQGAFTQPTGVLQTDGVGVPITPLRFSTRVLPSGAVQEGVVQTPGLRLSNSKERSFFGNVTAYIGDKTEISGGLRTISYKEQGTLAFSGAIIPEYTTNLDLNHTVYSATLKHRFSDDFMAYASVGSSWRPNGNAVGGPTRPSPLQVRFLTTPPETSTSYEVGIRASALEKRLTFNLTAYQQDFTNYPFRAPTPVLAVDSFRSSVRGFNYASGVPVRVRGIEAEFGARPVNGLSIGGVLSFADGKIRGGQVPCFDLNRDGVPDVVTSVPTVAQVQSAYGGENIASCSSNSAANTTPRWTGTLTSEYSTPIDGNTDGFLRGLYSWQGPTENDTANSFDRISAFGILNVYVGIHDPENSWELSFYGKNITNTYRVLTRTNGPAATTTANGAFTTTNYFGITSTQPREFGIVGRMSFGSR